MNIYRLLETVLKAGQKSKTNVINILVTLNHGPLLEKIVRHWVEI